MYSPAIAGASTTQPMVTTARTTKPKVRSRLVKSWPPSSWFLIARTSCGTSTVLKTPPASRMYRLFGIVFAAVKMSPRSAVPMAAASRAIRTNPSRRDSTVPAAITAAERRVRSAILRTDSFFQGRVRSDRSGSAVRLRAIVGRVTGPGVGGDIERFGVQSVGGLGGLCGLRRRRVAALGTDPAIDADERRTEQQSAGGADQYPADAAVLAGLDQQLLGLADRVAGRVDHLGVGPDQTVLLGARVDPRRPLLPRAQYDGLEPLDLQVGPVHRRDHDADPDRPLGVVGDRQRERALAAGQVDLDLLAQPAVDAGVDQVHLAELLVGRAEFDRGEVPGFLRETVPAGRRRAQQGVRHHFWQRVLVDEQLLHRAGGALELLDAVQLGVGENAVRRRGGGRLRGLRPGRARADGGQVGRLDPPKRQAVRELGGGNAVAVPAARRQRDD